MTIHIVRCPNAKVCYHDPLLTRLWYELRHADLWAYQGRLHESPHALCRCLEDSKLPPFVEVRRYAIGRLVISYISRGQLRRALWTLTLAVDLVADEDHFVKADLAMREAGIYLMQSRLSEALDRIHFGQYWLQSLLQCA